MAHDRQKFDKRNKHFPGELLKHKKHGYIVRLVGKGERGWGRVIELVRGPVPKASFTFGPEAEPGALGQVAPVTLNMCFEALGPGAKILFSNE